MKWTAVVGFGERLRKSTERMGVLFLTLFALTLCAVPNTPNIAVADRRLCDNGGIFPLNPFVLDTQDIILECVSRKEAKNLSFQIGRDPHPVDEKYIVKRNETYVKLVIPNVSKQNVSEYGEKRFIQCLDVDTKKCIDNSYIKLEYYPRPVQDDVCVMLDFKELSCNWSLGIPPYKFLKHINVTSKFAFSQTTMQSHDSLVWVPCPNGTQKSCHWSYDSLRDKGRFLKIKVRINVTNTLFNVSKVIEKYYLRDDIVLSSPVQNLTSHLKENSTCIQLTWQQISEGRHYKHNISFHSECDVAEKSTLLTSCEIHSNVTWYEVEINGVQKKYQWTDFQRKMGIPKICETEGCSISVLARNDVGRAAEISTLEINPQTEVPKDSQLIIEYLREEGRKPQFFAEIRIDEDNLPHYENITHTVTWCKSMSAICCKEPIKWLEDIKAGNGLRIPVADGTEKYEFGLVTKGYSKKLKKIVSTDIQLVQCLYLYKAAPKKPVPGVNLAEATLANSLTVKWEGYDCQKSVVYLQNSVPYVENYIVTFCSAEQPAASDSCVCFKQRKEVSVSRTLTEYTVQDLNPGGYCVWVAANNSHGLGPKNSNNLFHRVTDGSVSNTNLIIAIVVSLVVSAILLLLVVRYLWRRVKDWFKARKEVILPLVQGDTIIPSVTPAIPPRNYVDNQLWPEDRGITETSLNQVSDGDDAGIFEDSRSPLLGYDIAEDIECGSHESLNSLLSQARGCQDTECSSMEDITVLVNSAINGENLDEDPDAQPEGIEIVSDELNDSYPCEEKISVVVQEVSEFSKEYGEVFDISSGHHFDESKGTAAELKNGGISFSENTSLDGVNVDTDTKMSNIPFGVEDVRSCDSGHNDSKNSNETDNDCEFIDWNDGSIMGYSAIPLTNPCSDVSDNSDFDDSPLLDHKDTTEPDTIPQVENTVSAESNESVVSSESKDRDSAVFLSDNSTDDSLQQVTLTDTSVTCTNIGEETGQSTVLPVVSLPTSDYEGSDDQKLELVKATKGERREIIDVKDQPAEPKEGYSQAKHIEI